jgi:3-oxoacyl-ACP reductase-like protein
MGLLSNLISKIFSHAPVTATAATSAPAAQPAVATQPTAAAAPAVAAPPAAAPTPMPTGSKPATPVVDIAAVMSGLAAKNPEKLDWKRSIVDLMKLVGMDSSLSARKELATELHYTGDMNDSASMNVWLHKEVLKKLAENGGKVPPELLS